jgi:hypothetical protein
MCLLQPLADPPTEYRIFVGRITGSDDDLSYPYLLLTSPPATRAILNLTGNLSDATTTHQLMAVGRTEDEVLQAIDRGAGLLQGVRPVVPGRYPGLIRQVIPEPILVPDDAVVTPAGTPTYTAVLQFQLNSTAAPAA